jgi:hypothetical protein
MTIVSFLSVKGAPGVTTVTCLVGATWPPDRKVAVIEADPGGGDLAARYHLSSRDGWPSFNATARRAETTTFESHLQQLPGGLDVLVGTRGLLGVDAARSVKALYACMAGSPNSPWDLLVDLGRLSPGTSETWMDLSDRVVVCARNDAASLMQVREKASSVLERCRGGVRLAVVGGGGYSNSEIEGFTGIPVLGACPFDPVAAAVIAGERRGARRLHRSPLVSAATAFASTLASVPDSSGDGEASGVEVIARLDSRQSGHWRNFVDRLRKAWSSSEAPNSKASSIEFPALEEVLD